MKPVTLRESLSNSMAAACAARGDTAELRQIAHRAAERMRFGGFYSDASNIYSFKECFDFLNGCIRQMDGLPPKDQRRKATILGTPTLQFARSPYQR